MTKLPRFFEYSNVFTGELAYLNLILPAKVWLTAVESAPEYFDEGTAEKIRAWIQENCPEQMERKKMIKCPECREHTDAAYCLNCGVLPPPIFSEWRDYRIDDFPKETSEWINKTLEQVMPVISRLPTDNGIYLVFGRNHRPQPIHGLRELFGYKVIYADYTPQPVLVAVGCLEDAKERLGLE